MQQLKAFGTLFLLVMSVAGWAQPDSTPQRVSETDLLRQIERAVEQRDYEAAMQELEALDQRARRGNPALQAYLTHLVARTLHQSREMRFREELLRLWESLRRHYQRQGNTPLEIEATLALAFWHWQTDRNYAETLLQQVWERVRTVPAQPLQMAQVLSSCAEDWFQMQEWAICRRLWERALELQQSGDADAITLARSHYNLGTVALKQGRLEPARQHLQQSLTLQGAEPADPALQAATLSAFGEVAYRGNAIEQARAYYQRALALYEANRLETLDTAQAHLGLATIALKEQDWERAYRHYERARSIAEATAPNSREWAMARLGLGAVELERGALPAAADHLNAIKDHPRLEPREKAQLAHELGRLAWRQGNWQEAVQQFEQTLALQRTGQDPPLEIAKTLYNLGVLMLELGDLARAREWFQQCLEIRQREAPGSREVAHTLTALGFVAFQARQLVQAQQYLNEALELYRLVNAPPLDRSRALMGRGMVATELGELEAALNDLEAAHTLQSSHGAALSPLRAQTLIAFGNLMSRRMQWDIAAVYYQQALRMATGLPRGNVLIAQAFIGLGNLALRQRDLNRAESLYLQAWETLQAHSPQSPLIPQLVISLSALAVESGDMERLETLETQLKRSWGSNPELMVRIALNKGILYLRRQEVASAAAELSKALQPLQEGGGSPLLRAHILYHLGVVEMRRGNPQQARAYLEQALQLHQRLAPNTLGNAMTQLSLAKLDYREGNPQSAATRLEDAIRIIERQSATIFDPDTQALFQERYYEAYTLLALLEAERGNFARAAELVEQSRARVLTTMLYTRQLDWSSAPPALQALLRERENIELRRIELRAVIERAYASDDEPGAREASLRLAELDGQQQALEEQMRRQFPQYARLFSPPALSLNLIQQQLDPEVALLYHALVEDNLLIVVVTQREVRAYYRPVDLKIADLVVRFREAIVQRHPEATQLGRTLYQMLIEPAAESLTAYRRVLLCPEGELNQLPWAALVVNDKPTYWIEQVAIHLTPSMGVYRYARSRQVATQGALIAAVSQYQRADAAQQPSPTQLAQRAGGTRGALENIPAAREEATRLETLLEGATVLREEEVTPEAIRERARAVRLVHIACHARADSARPLDSALQLGVDETRWVRAADIITGWSLDAELVMLSACETILGRVYRYEGVLGLARAFLFAGSKTVGASLWRVQDESTAELMIAFYENYLQGRPKDQALREAQLRFLRGQKRTLQGSAGKSEPLPSEPYYWAGFMIIGNCR